MGKQKHLALAWTQDATYPLLGEPWRIALKPSGEIQMACQSVNAVAGEALTEQFTPQLNPSQIEKFVMAWYGQQAITCFKQRIAIYAQALNLPLPHSACRAPKPAGAVATVAASFT